MAGIAPGHPTALSASISRLFCVIAGAGSQVRGNRDQRIGDQGFVKAPVGIRVVVDDLEGADNAVRILLNFVRCRARSIPDVNPLADKGNGSSPTADEVQQYADGVVSPLQIVNDNSYAYRGFDESLITDPMVTVPTHLGTSPRYHAK